MKLAGPAIIESPGTTIVVHPDDRVEIDRFRNVVIQVGDGEGK